MIEWFAEHHELEGTYNCVSQNAVTNEEFMRVLRKHTGHIIGLPAYEWMLKIGARLIGTEPELILKSRWILPTKILQSGFEFRYPYLKDAFEEILNQTPRKRYHLF
jgi:NAD dependent epimerase/dehydratase family enzyme